MLAYMNRKKADDLHKSFVKEKKIEKQGFEDFCESDDLLNSYKIHKSLRDKGDYHFVALPNAQGEHAIDVEEGIYQIVIFPIVTIQQLIIICH